MDTNTRDSVVTASGSAPAADGCRGLPGALRQVFCPQQGLVAGASHQLALETDRLLRTRLSAAALLVFAALAAFFVRGLLLDAAHFPLDAAFFQVTALCTMAVVGAAGLLLLSGRPLGRLGLRVLELVLFGVAAAHVLFITYAELAAFAERGDAQSVGSFLLRPALVFYALMAAYGMFIPNTWRRAAAMVLPMASAPLLLLAVLWLRKPGFRELLPRVASGEDLSFMAIMLGIGAATVIYASHVIHSLRRAALKVREMGMYKLVERIGEGGMGEVWRAEHRMLSRPAAIKVIRAEVVRAADQSVASTAARRFEREAQATASLRSPHTIEIYDFGTTHDGSFYYVMEYLDGLDLDTLVERHGPLPAERVVYLLDQAVGSLAEAHQNGLIHRDVKPSNLHVTSLGLDHDFLKVLDFGLVKYNAELASASTKLTNEGVTTGTPAYMPPELALGNGVIDARTDIYALGCVAYWMLTGQLVFPSRSPLEMIVDHVKTPPQPLSQRVAAPIPAELEALIMRCLEKDPARRPQSMLDLRAALGAVPLEDPWTPARAEAWWRSHLPAARQLNVA